MPAGREVLGYVVSNSTKYVLGGSTGGTPIYLNKIAETPATALGFFESGGPGPLYTYTGVSVERPTLQLISRSSSYATARDNAQTVWNMLAAVTSTTIAKTSSTGVTSYLTITPVQSPTDMGQDAEELALITCNFIIEKELS